MVFVLSGFGGGRCLGIVPVFVGWLVVGLWLFVLLCPLDLLMMLLLMVNCLRGVGAG